MSATSPCPTSASTSWRNRRLAQIIPTRLTFVDIAGPRARRVEGRGARQPVPRQHPRGRRHRPCGALLRGRDITHVEGKIDPIADIETIETELMLADLDSLEKRVVNIEKKAKQRRQGSQGAGRSDEPRLVLLREGKPARLVERSPKRRSVRDAGPADLQAGALCLQRREEASPTRAMNSPTRRRMRAGEGMRGPSSSPPRSRARSR
jgi:ribosome-binding ATPase